MLGTTVVFEDKSSVIILVFKEFIDQRERETCRTRKGVPRTGAIGQVEERDQLCEREQGMEAWKWERGGLDV